MKTSSTVRFGLLPLACAVLAATAGCNGPTKTGIEAREAAYDRANVMGAQVQYDQARQAFMGGDFKKALKEINAAIERRDEAPEYYVLRGQIHLEQQRLERALADFDKATELDPERADARYYAGIVYQRWSDDERAYEAYSAAFAADSENAAYLLASAETLVALGRLDEARAMLEPKLSYFENSSAMHELLGQVAMLQEDYATAVASFGRAARLDDEDQNVQRELIRAQYLADQYVECLDTIQHLSFLNLPFDAETVRTKARCLFELGRLEAARDAYIELVREVPNDIEGWVEYAATACRLEDWRRVGEASSRLLSLAPYRFEGYVFKGMIEQRRGDAAAAHRLFSKAAEINPKDPLPHVMLAELLARVGDEKGAAEAQATASRLELESAVAGVSDEP